MANIAITAASVVIGSNAVVEHGVAGEAVTAGQAAYKDVNDKSMLADSNSATPAARKARGLALNNAAANQPLSIIRSGDLTMNAVLTAGTPYFLSDTPGAICPIADVGSGEYVCQIGIAKSTTVLAIDIQYPDVSL